MTKFIVDVWLDGYTDEEQEEHCDEGFVADAINDSGATSVMVRKIESPDLDALFDLVTKVVAHPHKTIVEHDRVRAAKIFEILDNYLDCEQFLNNKLSKAEKDLMKKM